MADNLTRKIFKGFLWKFIVLFEPIDSESIFVLDLFLFIFILIFFFANQFGCSRNFSILIILFLYRKRDRKERKLE